MAAMRPVSFYGLRVPPNGLRIEANPGIPASFQITMAALDPTEDVTSGQDAPRAVLKIVRNIFDVVDDESDDIDDLDDDDVEAIRRRLGFTDDMLDASDQDSDEIDDDDDEDEEMVNGGPSDPEKQRKVVQEAIKKQLKEEEDDMELEALTNGINGKLNKGKGRASDDDLSDDGLSEYVVCTLDPAKNLQQPVNIYIDQDEECYFRVIGTHSVHLTGNFVLSPKDIHDPSDDEEEEDEEEEQERLRELLMGMDDSDEMDDEEEEEDEDDDESEEDELDDIADPRITEVASDDDAVPELVNVNVNVNKKNKNKRAAEDDDAGHPAKRIDKPDDKRQNKKLKTNAGQAASGAAQEAQPEVKETKKEKNAKQVKKEDSSPANGKKVQFAEKLEQGPTPSKAPPSGKRTVSGVQIEDKKVGEGPAAKKGDRVAMRYIGKLKDGKVFDANKKGKPFDFKLGSGEVIKGWDIGVAGMKVGSERRIIVPAKLAYGNKSLPGIPANSDLTFDLKLLSIN